MVSERVEASWVFSPGPCCCCSCCCWLVGSLPTGCRAESRSRRCWSSSFLRSAQARSRGGGLRSHRRWLTTAMDVRGMRDSSRVALTRGSLRACRAADMVVRGCRVWTMWCPQDPLQKKDKTGHRRLVLRHGDVKVVDLIICSQKRREMVGFTRPSLSAARLSLASLHAAG